MIWAFRAPKNSPLQGICSQPVRIKDVRKGRSRVTGCGFWLWIRDSVAKEGRGWEGEGTPTELQAKAGKSKA